MQSKLIDKVLGEIRELNLKDSDLEDISDMAKLENLEVLLLDDNPIKDIEPISELTNLKELSLSNTKINNITPLANLTNLEFLNISNCENLKGYFVLKNLKNLKVLNIAGNSIDSLSELYALKIDIELDKLIIDFDFFETAGYQALQDTLFSDKNSLNIQSENGQVTIDATKKPHDVFN